MRTYTLYRPAGLNFLTTVFFLLCAGGLLGLLLSQLGQFGSDGPPAAALALGSAAFAFAALRMLRIPRAIHVREDSAQIEFASPIRTVSLRASEVASIVPSPSQPAYLVLRHAGGRIAFLNQFNGFHEFLLWLKRTNPGVDLKGC